MNNHEAMNNNETCDCVVLSFKIRQQPKPDRVCFIKSYIIVIPCQSCHITKRCDCQKTLLVLTNLLAICI